MKPVRVLTAFFLIASGLLHAQTITRSELLGRPTDHSVTLQAFFSDTVEARVEYGTTPGSYTNQTPWQLYPASLPAEWVLNSLMPSTQYYYRLNFRLPGTIQVNFRPEYTFHTARPAGESFMYVVQADPHLDNQTDTAIYNRCLLNQLEDAPDFMIDLGDFLMTDKLKDSVLNAIPHDTIPYRCNLLRSYYEKACHSVPLFIALGNHEGEAGWYLNGTPNNIANWDTEERKKYFLNPAPDNFYSGDTTNYPTVGIRESYYAWTWGDALFIVLDPYWNTNVKPDSLHGWRWTLGETQYLWLKNTLENSNATFKYVFSHQIIGGDPDGRGGVEFADLYEWGGNNLDGTPGFAVNRPGWYKPIKDLLTENRVNIFFHGHDHFFGKQIKDCLIYQETPQPSHPNFSNANQAAVYGYLQGQILPNAGHLRVTVNPTETKVEYVRAYKAADETPNRHNKDVSATYFIPQVNCYDSLTFVSPVLWNSNYENEIAYPNPFSRSTTLGFRISSESILTIAVYDATGKLVRWLLRNKLVAAGDYKVIWEGDNYQGALAPSGTYTYTVSDRSRVINTGKLVLTR